MHLVLDESGLKKGACKGYSYSRSIFNKRKVSTRLKRGSKRCWMSCRESAAIKNSNADSTRPFLLLLPSILPGDLGNRCLHKLLWWSKLAVACRSTDAYHVTRVAAPTRFRALFLPLLVIVVVKVSPRSVAAIEAAMKTGGAVSFQNGKRKRFQPRLAFLERIF